MSTGTVRDDSTTRDGTPAAPGGLQQGLKRRHMQLIALGGVIGPGLFVGSGVVIRSTGPAAVLSFLAAGVLTVLIMRMLAEMTVARPALGSFYAHVRETLGLRAGFTVGWLYWYFFVIVVAVEAVAGGRIVQLWLPDVPLWAVSLVLMTLLTATNMVSARSYGAVALFVYLAIAVAQVRMRRKLERTEPERLTLKMWLFPWLSRLTIALMAVVIGAMAWLPDSRSQFWLSLLTVAVVLAGYELRRRKGPADMV